MPTILVADDNSNIQKMVTNALKDKGIEVIGVANGDAAIKKLEILNPDMVLADVFMPVKDGYELCEWIKGRERLAAVPVFLLVGAFDPLDEQRVQAVKADGVLKKPFVPPDHLIGAVSAMLERAAKTRAAAEMQTAHDEFASSVPHLEDTQKLPESEIAQLTGGGEPAAVEAEPEMDMYASRPVRLSFDEGDTPMGLDALEEGAAEGEEAAFRPSGMEGFDAAGQGGGVIEESRQPAPDEPPIKVDFKGEKLELVTSDDAEGMAHFTRMTASAPDLIGSGEQLTGAPEAAPAPPPMELAVPSIPEVRVSEPEAAPAGEPPADLSGLSGSEPAAVAPPPPPAAVEPPAEPEARPRPMPLSAAQQQVLVDEIVERVLSQLQPQIAHRIMAELGKGLETLQPQLLERITKEVIRPMAEDMFKKKTE